MGNRCCGRRLEVTSHESARSRELLSILLGAGSQTSWTTIWISWSRTGVVLKCLSEGGWRSVECASRASLSLNISEPALESHNSTGFCKVLRMKSLEFMKLFYLHLLLFCKENQYQNVSSGPQKPSRPHYGWSFQPIGLMRSSPPSLPHPKIWIF